MSTRIEIRKALPDDAPAACTLLRRSIEECRQDDHRNHPEVLGPWLGNKTPATVAAWFSTPSNFALVAESEGQLVGMALLTQAGKVALCYVLPEALRCGVGRALLSALEDQARAWNIAKLHLNSPAGATAFFERHGYLNAGKEKSCFGLDCDLMWKRLDETCATEQGAARKRFCNCSG
ncbi:GNAT family N-acetyltransferase [Massilia sp. ST3]|uniref:GNAT family N-acetyltransferase n=1 Tax=Massilia sp. ST3 TaxID=2824903 RepID=UPI001B826CB1|nr:GNAT family N-acetyltransferase [Massilia sp. ST3]MBQ5947237.1 GNAT family N-acetyltransferase [Massilia sp. ST3]